MAVPRFVLLFKSQSNYGTKMHKYIFPILFLLLGSIPSQAFEFTECYVLPRSGAIQPYIYNQGDSIVKIEKRNIWFEKCDTMGKSSGQIHIDVGTSNMPRVSLGDGWFDCFINRSGFHERDEIKQVYLLNVNDTSYVGERRRNINIGREYTIIDAKPIVGGDYLIIYKLVWITRTSSPHWAARITSGGDTLWTKEIWPGDYDVDDFSKEITGIEPHSFDPAKFYIYGIEFRRNRLRPYSAQGRPLHYAFVTEIDTTGEIFWSKYYQWDDVWDGVGSSITSMHSFHDGTYAIVGTKKFNAKFLQISETGDSLACHRYYTQSTTEYFVAQSLLYNNRILIFCDYRYRIPNEWVNKMYLLYVDENGDSLDSYLFNKDTVSCTNPGPMIVRPDGKVMIWFNVANGLYREASSIIYTFYPDGRPDNAAEEPIANQPSCLLLNPAYPNPFNSKTTIRFSLKEDSKARLTVYDLSGREVATLASGDLKSGNHTAVWSAEGLTSGIYLARLSTSNGEVAQRKLVLLK
jgi:hypothetical protein